MMDDKIPDERDWVGYEEDIDAGWAYQNFFGKSSRDVYELFEHNVIEAAEDIHRMPEIPFRYYLLALADYVRNLDPEISDNAASAASCLINYVLLNLKESPIKISNIVDHLLPTLEYLALDQHRLDADESIFGSFREKIKEIREICGRLG